MEQVYTPTKDYKVLVRCFTYNQSKYIEDALNGFAIQKTDFSFVCLVMDDASTDGEQEVIKAWMERECDLTQAENVEIEKSFIILVPHKTNSSCTFAFYFLKENLYGKGTKMPLVNPWRERCEYEALCEGDDYWTDPYKLQVQYDYMRTHPDCSMCYTMCKVYYEKQKKYGKNFGGPNTTFEEFMRSNTVPTLTVMYRTNEVLDYIKEIGPFGGGWPFSDYSAWLYYSQKGTICFMNRITGTYRYLEHSAYHGDYEFKINFSKCASDMLMFFAKKYDYDTTFVTNRRWRSLLTLSARYHKSADIKYYYDQLEKKHFSDFVKRYFHRFVYSKTFNSLRDII